ncbi:MAG: hypothetical protein JWM11_1841 [Planctomycetaceae bacterium]|nr:hypothetical protein [Planctomycetaceae bacterium]
MAFVGSGIESTGIEVNGIQDAPQRIVVIDAFWLISRDWDGSFHFWSDAEALATLH